jgi:hypothetical protein
LNKVGNEPAQQSVTSRSLISFFSGIQLSTIQLHPALQMNGWRTLVDCVPVDRERQVSRIVCVIRLMCINLCCKVGAAMPAHAFRAFRESC